MLIRSLGGLLVLTLLLLGVGGRASASPGIAIGEDQLATLPPVVKFTFSPQNPLPGQEVRFDASGSYDPDGYIKTFAWDFDRDKVVDKTGKVVYHSFPYPGLYFVTLVVIDNDHKAAEKTLRVMVKTPVLPPSPVISFPQACFRAEARGHRYIWFDASCSGSDVIRYEWRYGDGSQLTVTHPQWPHGYPRAGTYPVTLKVTYRDGRISQVIQYVTVPPHITTTVIRADIRFEKLRPEVQIVIVVSLAVVLVAALVLGTAG